MDIFRIFDALNDLRNIEVALDEVKNARRTLRVRFAATVSPIHNLETYAKLGKQLEKWVWIQYALRIWRVS